MPARPQPFQTFKNNPKQGLQFLLNNESELVNIAGRLQMNRNVPPHSLADDVADAYHCIIAASRCC